MQQNAPGSDPEPCEPQAPGGAAAASPGDANAGPGPARNAPGRRCRRCPRTLAVLRVHQAVGDGVGERQQLLGVQELQQVPAPRPLPLAQPRARHGRAWCSAERPPERAAGTEVPLGERARGGAKRLEAG